MNKASNIVICVYFIFKYIIEPRMEKKEMYENVYNCTKLYKNV